MGSGGSGSRSNCKRTFHGYKHNPMIGGRLQLKAGGDIRVRPDKNHQRKTTGNVLVTLGDLRQVTARTRRRRSG